MMAYLPSLIFAALVGAQIYWNYEVVEAFERLEDGNEFAIKEYNKQQDDQLVELITAIQGMIFSVCTACDSGTGQLDAQDRQKIMTICTIEVHARDVVTNLWQSKQQSVTCFAWQGQLRHRWDEDRNDCIVNICDASFVFSYEYLGNQPRLVITPLTDRCCMLSLFVCSFVLT